MRVQCKLDEALVELMELPRAHQRSAVRIPLRAIACIGRDDEDRRLGTMLLQDRLRMLEVVEIAVIEGQKQRAFGQRAAEDKIARMNEVEAFADEIAKLRVELLRRHREAVRAARIDLVIAKNAQRWPPEGKVRKAR
jgi:hypothetical protein